MSPSTRSASCTAAGPTARRAGAAPTCWCAPSCPEGAALLPRCWPDLVACTDQDIYPTLHSMRRHSARRPAWPRNARMASRTRTTTSSTGAPAPARELCGSLDAQHELACFARAYPVGSGRTRGRHNVVSRPPAEPNSAGVLWRGAQAQIPAHFSSGGSSASQSAHDKRQGGCCPNKGVRAVIQETCSTSKTMCAWRAPRVLPSRRGCACGRAGTGSTSTLQP